MLRMRDWIRHRLPSEESLKTHPRLRWMGPLLRRPWLWHLNRRGAALGAGIGVFFGFLIPVLQIAFAALFAVLLRANLPVAVISTLVTNPLTYAPVFVAAYRTGAAMLDEALVPGADEVLTDVAEAPDAGSPGWIERVRAIGKPLMLGLAVFAVIGGLGTWLLVHVAWTVAVLRKRRRRLELPRSPP
jgi:uncharacterized protein (DUF2062 family)